MNNDINDIIEISNEIIIIILKWLNDSNNDIEMIMIILLMK